MTAENTPAPEDDLPEQLRIRREKRANLIERGIEPYPVAVARTKSLKEIRDKYVNLEVDIATGDTESLTGRIIFKRDTGKLCFATLREGDGTELQAMLSLDKVGQSNQHNACERGFLQTSACDHLAADEVTLKQAPKKLPR